MNSGQHLSPSSMHDPLFCNDPLYTNYANRTNANDSESLSASNASRCFSSFNQSDGDAAMPEVSSRVK